MGFKKPKLDYTSLVKKFKSNNFSLFDIVTLKNIKNSVFFEKIFISMNRRNTVNNRRILQSFIKRNENKITLEFQEREKNTSDITYVKIREEKLIINKEQNAFHN